MGSWLVLDCDKILGEYFIFDGVEIAFTVEVCSKEARVLGFAAVVHIDANFHVELAGIYTKCGGEEEGVPDRHHRKHALIRVHIAVL